MDLKPEGGRLASLVTLGLLVTAGLLAALAPVLARAGGVAWEYREDRHDGTWEWIREIHDGDDVFRVLVTPEARRHLGRDREGREVVTGVLAGDRAVTVRLDPEVGTLLRLEYLSDLETLGDALVAWEWGEYRDLPGLGLFPRSRKTVIADRTFVDLTVDAILTGPAVVEGAIRIVVPDRPVEAGGPDLPLVEPRPAVDPHDPDHLVVATIVAAPDRAGPWHCAALASFDGGDTWSRSELDVERCIDPWVEFTAEGVLATAIEIGRDEERRFRLLGFHSSDGGRTWTDTPVSYGEAFDHEVLTVDPDGRIFMAARRDRSSPSGRPRHTLWVARSDDAGRSFRKLAELEPSTLSLSPTGVAVDGDTIVVGFRDSQRDVDGFRGEGMLARARSWVVRSEDGGTTFSPPMLVTDACASGVEGAFPGYPYLDGGPGGRLYHVCVRPGLDGMALTRSVDGGERWSDPVRVDGGPEESHVRTPMLAVGDAGRDGAPAVVGVAWFDRRDDPGCQRLWFTASTDGGESVLEPVEVSAEPSCPARGDNGRVAESWSMGGDYSSLVAGPDGRFHVVWADSRSGRFRLRHAVLQVEERGQVER